VSFILTRLELFAKSGSRFDGDVLSITGWGPVHPILTSSAQDACTDEQEGTGRAIAHAQQKYKDVKAKAKGIDKA
jgi:hypothetical protein